MLKSEPNFQSNLKANNIPFTILIISDSHTRSFSPKRGVHQYSMAGIPPIGSISPTCLKTYDIIPYNNNNISSNNNNNVVLSKNNAKNRPCLNKFKMLPPISNIPGLNPDSDKLAAAEKKTFRTFKIHDADSSYVKLAKQGGRKNLLEYQEYANKENKALFRKAVEGASDEIEVDNNNNNDINNNNNNSNYTSNKNYSSASAGKSIMEIKKQAKGLKEKKALKEAATQSSVLSVKERPDILPVDNTEILKHLSAPKRPLLPKLKPQRRLSVRLLKIGAR